MAALEPTLDTSMRYTFRQLAPGDVQAMQAMLSAFAVAFGDRTDFLAAEPDEPYLAHLLAQDDFIAVMAQSDDRTGGEIVGGAVAYQLDLVNRDRSEIYIHDLAVVEGHRRRGVATGVVDELKRIARLRNINTVSVQAERDDVRAIAFYRSLGREVSALHFDIPA
jgi:aminoglycoside 3-N-acetyltransferase I